jgi:ketopantoate reductase
MTTAIIGTGGLGSVIARQLAAGGETPAALERRQRLGTNAGGTDRARRGRRCQQPRRAAGRRRRHPRAAVHGAEERH